MKTKLYLLTTFILITWAVSAQWIEPAQNYKTLLMEDWQNNAWVNASRSTNTFDTNGHLTKTTMEEFTNGAWQNMAIMTNTLNDDGTVKETITQSWENGSWQDVSKTTYTYNASKQVLTASTQMNMEGLWIDFSKMTYTYNGQNQLTNQVTQIINMLSGTFELINSDQNIYSYNSDGTENQVVSQTWNASNEWENATRFTNTYNSSKKVTSDLSEKWENNAWVNESRTSYTLNTAGIIQESIEQEWVDNAWVNSFKDAFITNNNNELIENITQKWDVALSQWVNDSRLTYTYGSTGIHAVDLSGQSLVVFPNPFTSQITIQSQLKGIYNIEVYNASGKLISSVKTSGNSFKLNLDGLEDGVYMIKTPQNNQSIKVLKTK